MRTRLNVGCSHHFAKAATTATMRAGVIIARPLPLISKLHDDEVAVNQRF